ncbi:MAG: hypothetical protein K2N61_05600 [Lachnospiraceae bacterium]|nr:hypothetical protein [Lachnospiraceae bacterium]
MYIMSQDKKIICNCNKINVEKNFGGAKSQKYMIQGATDLEGNIHLGVFEEEKLAVTELQNIFDALADGERVYAVKIYS